MPFSSRNLHQLMSLQVLTSVGTLQELVFRNTALTEFAEQEIDLSGEAARGACRAIFGMGRHAWSSFIQHLPLLRAGLSRLTALRFAACAMRVAPAALASLPALKSLVFEACPVSEGMALFGLGSGSFALAPELSRLTALEVLRFMGCHIQELPVALAGMTVSCSAQEAGSCAALRLSANGWVMASGFKPSGSPDSRLPPLQALRCLEVGSSSIEVQDHFHIHLHGSFRLPDPGALLLGLPHLEVCQLHRCCECANLLTLLHLSLWVYDALQQVCPSCASIALPCPQEVVLRSCGFKQPSPTIPLPPSVRSVTVATDSAKLAGVDFGPQATGLEEGEPGSLWCRLCSKPLLTAAGKQPAGGVQCPEQAGPLSRAAVDLSGCRLEAVPPCLVAAAASLRVAAMSSTAEHPVTQVSRWGMAGLELPVVSQSSEATSNALPLPALSPQEDLWAVAPHTRLLESGAALPIFESMCSAGNSEDEDLGPPASFFAGSGGGGGKEGCAVM